MTKPNSKFSPKFVGKKIKIFAAVGQLPRMQSEACAALALSGIIYKRGGTIVQLDESGRTTMLTPDTILIPLATHAEWVKIIYVKDVKTEIPADPPAVICKSISKSNDLPHIPELLQVLEHPMFDPKTNKLTKQGYDPESKYFGLFESASYKFKLETSKADALAALDRILQLFRTFDLATEADKAAVVCAVLTALLRPVLETAPLILFTAPTSGSGKGMLVRLVSRFAIKGEPASKVLLQIEAEINKQILSSLMESEPVIFYDEIEMSHIDSPSMRTLATSPNFSGRLLGFNKICTPPTRALVLMTANNSTPASDMARRVLTIRIDPKCENPSIRKFDFDPIKLFDQNRNEFLKDALTVVAAYLHAGQPDLSPNAIGGFSDWNRLCRLPVIWLMNQDPAARMIEQISDDPVKDSLALVMFQWHAFKKSSPVTAADLLTDKAFMQAFLDATGHDFYKTPSHALSLWLGKHVDRIIDGKIIRKLKKLNGYQMWQLCSLPTKVD
jgi:hypothetical protein